MSRTEVYNSKYIYAMNGHSKNVNSITTDSKFCYSGSNDCSIRVWSLENGYCTSKLASHEAPVLSVAVHKGKIVSGDSHGVLKSWKISTERELNTFQSHTARISTFVIDKHQRLFSGSADHTIKLWDLNDGNLKRTYKGHSDTVSHIICNIKSNRFFSSSIDNSAISWDIETGTQIQKFSEHKDWIFSMLYDSNKKQLYTCSQDRMVKVWDPKSGKCIHTLFGHEYGVIKMILHKNFLYTASWDSRIGIYNLKKPLQMPKFLSGHSGKLRCLTRYEDHLYSGGNDGQVRIWSLKAHKCKAVYKGHVKPVTSIIVPNKYVTLSCGEEKKIFRWTSSSVLSSAKSKQSFETLALKEKNKIELHRDHSYDLGSKASEQEVKIIINGEPFRVSSKLNLLEACRKVGFDIAALCYHPALGPVGTCKCCVVDVKSENSSNYKRACACATEVWNGMDIKTDSPQVREQLMSAIADLRKKQKNRSLIMKMYGNTDNRGDLSLENYIGKGESRLGTTKFELNDKVIEDKTDSMLDLLINRFSTKFIDKTNLAIQVDHTKCIDCTRCVNVCSNLQGMNVYSTISSTVFSESLMPALNTKGKFLSDTMCISCGQCSLYCPSGAITEIDHTENLEVVMKTKKKLVIVGIAPSCRISLAEIFKLTPGSLTTGQCVHLLKLLGFNRIFDVQFTADLTIMEEGTELLHRIKDPNSILPMFTSCCPAWVNMVEKQYPNIIPHLSSCRSPQQMFGSVIKNYYAKRVNVDPKDIFCVTVMPCTAKKKELLRDQFRNPETGLKDVDLALTVREIGRMVAKRGIEFSELEEREFDNPLGFSTGSAQLFAGSGGVMEAAVRSAYWLKFGENFPALVYNAVRGLKGIKEAVLDFDGKQLRLAAVSGGKNIHKFLETWGTSAFNYDFIEIMACPGGCIGGGGQPRSNLDIVPIRIKSVYQREQKMKARSSHDNPYVKKLYQEWLKKPYGEKAMMYLHTTYAPFKFKSSLQKEKQKHGDINKGLTSKNSFLILYGSQTGTAEKAAEKIADITKSKKKKVRIMEMNEFGKPINLKKEKFVIFVTSTFWDGSFPENALQFWEDLKNLQPMSLTRLKYCTFGLGSSTYTRFNNAAKQIDDKLKELGATEILPIGLSDREDKNGYLSTLNPWLQDYEKIIRKIKKRKIWK
ncbi:iron hydrogenase [Anaeramoeba flamelloides]|uniref:Iron hydrogenase n=1 Tax=Anaeramoeba flamelloides TaxID=1746091 RepID=A0ABQ8Y2R9_9EUKA|nr:iron hydrogenase [Anaeramoeba flamelloides]